MIRTPSVMPSLRLARAPLRVTGALVGTSLLALPALAQTPPPPPGVSPPAPVTAQQPPPATLAPAPPPSYRPPPSALPPSNAQPTSQPQPPPGGYGPVAQPLAMQPALLPDVIEDEGQPLPAGFRRERRPRGGLVIAGIGVFAPLYAFSLTAAIGSDDSRDRWLALPVLGPVIDLLQRRSCSGDSDCQDNGARTVLGMDFLGQATGVLLFSLGYAIPREVFVRGEQPNERASKSLPVLLIPGMIGGSAGAPGLSAVGTF